MSHTGVGVGFMKKEGKSIFDLKIDHIGLEYGVLLLFLHDFHV